MENGGSNVSATAPINVNNEDGMKAVRKCTVELCRDMNVDDLTPALFAKKLLTINEVQKLQLPIMTMREKNLFIVTTLPSKGANAFRDFVDALRSTSEANPAHNELVELLLSKVNNT